MKKMTKAREKYWTKRFARMYSGERPEDFADWLEQFLCMKGASPKSAEVRKAAELFCEAIAGCPDMSVGQKSTAAEVVRQMMSDWIVVEPKNRRRRAA